MDVSGRDDRLFELFAQGHDRAVQILKILVCPDIIVVFFFLQESVVAERLDLQIIVERDDTGDLFVRYASQDGIEQLSVAACGADDQVFTHFLKRRLRDTRPPVIILEVRIRHEPVQRDTSGLVFDENGHVIGVELLDRILIRLAFFRKIPERKYAAAFKPREQFQIDLRRAFRVVHGAVMLEKRDVKLLGDRVQTVSGKLRKQKTGDPEGVRPGEVRRRLRHHAPEIPDQERNVEFRIVSDKETSVGEGHELRKHLFDRRGIPEVFVRDAGQAFDPVRDLLSGIDERAETVCDTSVFDADSADLDDAVLVRRKPGRFQVENDKRAREARVGRIYGNSLGVVDQIAFHAVKDLDRRSFLFESLGGLEDRREGLHISVIRDGHGGMSVECGPLDEGLRVQDRIVVGVLGMRVKLDAFLRGVVPALLRERQIITHDAVDMLDHEFMVVAVYFRVSLDPDGTAGIDGGFDFFEKLLTDEKLDTDGVAVIGKRENENGALAALRGLCLDRKDLSQNDHGSLFVRKIGRELLGSVLEGTTIKHVRIICLIGANGPSGRVVFKRSRDLSALLSATAGVFQAQRGLRRGVFGAGGHSRGRGRQFC